MRSAATTRCQTYGHPEFRLCFDPAVVLECDIAFMLRTLEDWVAGGERFADGETIQFGWCTLVVRANPDSTMSLLEPDFRQIPINWTESVTSALLHLRRQKDTCESYFESDALSFPSLLQSCIACTQLESAEAVVMERTDPEHAVSGWFLGCLRDEHDHNSVQQLESISLFEAVLRNARALPYLALPPGVLLQISPDGLPQVYREGAQLQPRKGSYVEALVRGRPTSACS
jgi:hypothetical protein